MAREHQVEHLDRDYPLTEVPAGERRGFWSLLVVLFGFTFFVPTMLAGAQLGVSFAWERFLWAITLGSLILGAYVAAIAVIGARTGLTTVLLSRYSLGTGGAKLADLLLGGTQIGWFAVSVAFVAQLLSEVFGIPSFAWVVMIGVGVLMGVTAYYGYRGMELLSAVSVPLLLIVAFWVVTRSLAEAGGWSGLSAAQPSGQLSFATALTIVVGTFASGGTQVPNWSRFARAPWQALGAGIVAFFIGNALMLFFGGIGTTAFDQSDFVGVLLQLELVAFAVGFLLLSAWTTNDNAAYAFGVAGSELFGVNDKRPFVVGGVAIAILLALTGIYAYLTQYLILLGIFIPPLGGVVIGDYLFTWRGRLPALADVAFRRVRWSGIAAYVAGSLAAWLGDQFGFGVPPVQGIIIATLAVPIFNAACARLGLDDAHTVAAPAVAQA